MNATRSNVSELLIRSAVRQSVDEVVNAVFAQNTRFSILYIARNKYYVYYGFFYVAN